MNGVHGLEPANGGQSCTPQALQAGNNSITTENHQNLQQEVETTTPQPFGVLVHNNTPNPSQEILPCTRQIGYGTLNGTARLQPEWGLKLYRRRKLKGGVLEALGEVGKFHCIATCLTHVCW